MLTRCETGLLRRLAETPFADRLDLAALSGWSRGAVYAAMDRLQERGMADAIPHAAPLLPPTRRYYLTIDGLSRVAEIEGVALEELLRHRPVSARWRRVLLERLDALGVIYRLAAAVANFAHPVRFRWFRAAPLDAGIVLPGGRAIAVVRQGLTTDRTGFAKRLWRLSDETRPGALLLLAPDGVRLRQARRMLDALPPGLPGPGGRRGWRRSRFPGMARALRPGPAEPAGSAGLRGAGRGIARRGCVPPGVCPHGPGPASRPAGRAQLPAARDAQARREARPGPALRLALAGPGPPGELLGVKQTRRFQTLEGLMGLDLAASLVVEGRRLLALTDRGLALLARRDRSAVGAARRGGGAVRPWTRQRP